MSIIKGLGCIILGFLMGITMALLLNVPENMSWLAGLICVFFTTGLLFLFHK